MKILFVCTGNTCRSAMAEGLMKKIAAEQGLEVQVFSRGIYASNDSSASPEAISALKSLYDIDISGHRSARLSYSDIENSDFIYAMTENHRNLIQITLEEDALAAKIKTFSEQDIQDPYMGTKKEYEACAKELYKGIVRIIKEDLGQ